MLPSEGDDSGQAQVPDHPPLSLQGLQAGELLLFMLPHPLSTALVNSPIIQHASITLSAEAPSLELTSLAVHHLFSVGFLPETDLIC